ncbi:hypothetical protein GCM10011360_00140 [Primorskyibacter flagellatus]|uniref:Leucyl aminopeptidase (Aminopeptidase T) n=1 Tax=Primorskyibacter flagellatus TaxID=1387277 RepID=A0A916ZUU9_9RHOB|nr:hypothetical protein [Primorskyibacter flagellatus]GGE15292.1 hypothetical protein GCM10011360_00140 [Primorskyibacter flagellatus]
MPEPSPAFDFDADWNRIAKLIVQQSLKTEPGERVILHADPTYFPELTEQVRIEILRAGAVEVACAMRDSPGLHAARTALRRQEEPELREMEDAAVRGLFDAADIYIWLPTSWQMAYHQTERILTTWPGRSVHFHWITDVWDPHVFRVFSEACYRALWIDHAALDARQRRIMDALRGAEVHVTCPRGTDFRLNVRPDAHFHHGNGDASRAFIADNARPGSARDREVELPCGLVRTVDFEGAEGRVVAPATHYAGRFVGDMALDFAEGRMTRFSTERHDDWAQRRWEEETGDKDLISELNIGTNPELKPIPGVDGFPYYGYGEGILRLDMGENWESGGCLHSSVHRWMSFADASLTANGVPVLDAGRLVLE